MILVDTSAWIEFLRDTGSAVCTRVDELLAADLAVCDPIRMEVLAGHATPQLRCSSPRRTNLPVLHADAGFDVLARHTPLRLDTL